MDQSQLQPPLAAPRASFLARMSGGVARHPQLCLAVIVVLLLVAAWMLVHYRGLFGFGGGGCKAGGAAKKKRAADGADGTAGKTEADAQVDSLVAAINVNGGAS